MKKEYKKYLNLILNIILIIMLITIFVVTSMISYKTKLDEHPDERVHYEASKYYTTHFMPPKFTSDEIINSFSVHGESRLTELDCYYFLVGKYSSLISIFTDNEVFTARTFNLILLAIVLIMCYKLYRNKSYLFMPFLFVSQVWYVFAYVNSDAWAIFLNLIFVYQLFFKDSMFNKYINMEKEEIDKNKKKTIAEVAVLGLLFYFLLISKMNYLVATGINAIVYLIINNKTIFKKEKMLKIGTVLLIGIIAFGIRLGIDYGINRLDRIKNMEQIRLLRATEEFKPPYNPGQLNVTFKWSERGRTIDSVIKNKTFYQTTLFSFIGVYGYMDKYATKELYNIITTAYVIFILYIIGNNIYKIYKQRKKDEEYEENEKGRILPVMLAIFGILLTIALSMYRSYAYDFQPQGRYLFGIIPLICMLMYNHKKNILLDIFCFVVIAVLIFMYIQYGYCKFIS